MESNEHCGKCKKIIRSSYCSVKCAACSKFFHAGCTNLPITDFVDFLSDSKKENNWICTQCHESGNIVPESNIENNKKISELITVDPQNSNKVKRKRKEVKIVNRGKKIASKSVDKLKNKRSTDLNKIVNPRSKSEKHLKINKETFDKLKSKADEMKKKVKKKEEDLLTKTKEKEEKLITKMKEKEEKLLNKVKEREAKLITKNKELEEKLLNKLKEKEDKLKNSEVKEKLNSLKTQNQMLKNIVTALKSKQKVYMENKSVLQDKIGLLTNELNSCNQEIIVTKNLEEQKENFFLKKLISEMEEKNRLLLENKTLLVERTATIEQLLPTSKESIKVAQAQEQPVKKVGPVKTKLSTKRVRKSPSISQMQKKKIALQVGSLAQAYKIKNSTTTQVDNTVCKPLNNPQFKRPFEFVPTQKDPAPNKKLKLNNDKTVDIYSKKNACENIKLKDQPSIASCGKNFVKILFQRNAESKKAASKVMGSSGHSKLKSKDQGTGKEERGFWIFILIFCTLFVFVNTVNRITSKSNLVHLIFQRFVTD